MIMLLGGNPMMGAGHVRMSMTARSNPLMTAKAQLSSSIKKSMR